MATEQKKKSKRGRYKPGQSGNPAGKPKGAQSLVARKTKEIIVEAIDKQSLNFNLTMEKIRKDKPVEWAKIMVKLMDFVLPKKIDITSDDNPLGIPIATWAENKK